MAVPKRRRSTAKKKKQRTHKQLKAPNISYDEKLGEYRMSHRVSKSGNYNGKKVID
ncbi:50S ribosomal protein L32 [Marinilactibacillus sp. Marseille-P9653]|uniref:50S ribosomal protein L32 n=1 Tax=Marinilactibacillus sp. Marseille-P9653 TaxID=2866583 RepID=UPI001CE3DF2F|nr:50S ribosomal protein L32 [Marinilactibacillus sp. Marseille-P9653]